MNFLETIWRNMQKNENKRSLQRSCHYQTTEQLTTTDLRQAGKKLAVHVVVVVHHKSNLTLVSFTLFLNYYDCELK